MDFGNFLITFNDSYFCFYVDTKNSFIDFLNSVLLNNIKKEYKQQYQNLNVSIVGMKELDFYVRGAKQKQHYQELKKYITEENKKMTF